ncbi:MAG: DUF2911 domain-containing protein [Thermoanaerobaculia bacterium]
MFRLLARLLGMALAVALAWVLLVTIAPGSWVASWAPCPRNLAWVPAWLPRASPLGALKIDLPGGSAKLCYGRPSLRGREMLGGVLPYGELWRLGANEPTTLHVDRVVHIGDMVLAAGSYSLYAYPGSREWDIVVNRSTRQWGLESEYTDEVRGQEVGRIRVPAGRMETPVQQLTFRAVPAVTGAVDLIFEWQDTTWRLPIDTSLHGEEFEGGPPPTPES